MFEVSGRTSTPAFARLAAGHMLSLAQQQEEGSFYPQLAAQVFTAFMLEGAVSFIGKTFFTDWKEKDAFCNQLERVCTHIGFENSGNTKKDIADLRKIRNAFAHPKVHDYPTKVAAEDIDRLHELGAPEWYTSITYQQSARLYTSICAYCDALLTAAARFYFETVTLKKNQRLISLMGDDYHSDPVADAIASLMIPQMASYHGPVSEP